MKPEEIKKYEKELTTFANQMLRAYANTSMLKEFLTIKEFEGQKKEFMQTAQRVKLPKRFFYKNDNYENSILAGDFVRAIVNGERNFILRSILKLKNIPKHEIESFNYEEFRDIVSKMENPTDVFIPLDSFFHLIYSQEFGKRTKFESGKEPMLLVGNKKIQIHWITSYTNINEIIVTDKNKVKIIQKTFEQSKIPKEIKPVKEFLDYSKNKKLMLYFGEKDKDNFDFIFRTVTSKPELEEGAIMIINVKNKSKET